MRSAKCFLYCALASVMLVGSPVASYNFLQAQDVPPMPTPAVVTPEYTKPKAVITPEIEGADLSYEVGDVGWLSSTGADYETILWDTSKAPIGTKIIDEKSIQFPTKTTGRYSITQFVGKYNPQTRKPDLAYSVFVFEIFNPNIPDVKPDVPDVPVVDEPTKPKPVPVVVDQFKVNVGSIVAKHTELKADSKPKIAAALRSVAALVADNKLTTRRDITKATADAIVAKIGLNAYLEEWVEIGTEITSPYKPSQMCDFAKAWATIADVLESK